MEAGEKPVMAAGHKKDPVWESFNEVPLPMGKAGMRAKCKHCNKEMQGLVARMKRLHEKCSNEDDKRNISEQAGSSVPDVNDPSELSMLSIDMDNKENGSLHTENLVENGRPPDPADWAVTDVVNYFRTVGFEEQANAFQEQEIDGKSLLLMTRNDVLTGLSLKLGPALKIYEYHVKPLQTQHLKNNSL